VALSHSRFAIAAAAIAVNTLLSACGDRFAAPAAVVDGSRISVDTLQQELDVLLLDPQLKEQVTGPRGETTRKDLTRRLLAFLIQLQVVQRYASVNDISVSSAQVDQALQETVDGVGGQAQFQRELQVRGLTVGTVRRNLRRQILFNEVVDSIAVQSGLSTSATQEEKGGAFQQWFSERLRASDIDVNPRFGRLDRRSGQIVPINSTAT
jgi:SurA N-terminal domain